MSHPVRDFARAFADAHDQMLPRITGRFRFSDSEVRAFLFPQLWPTSSHGFDSPGEEVPTEAYTIVILATIEYAAVVYINGEVAYGLCLKDKAVREHFLPALKRRDVPSCAGAKTLYGESYFAADKRRAPRRPKRPKA